MPPMPPLSFPFSFRVAQMMSGLGFGCGIGIGVGRPVNLGAFPMGREVMSTASSLNSSMSTFSQPVRTAILKLGVKNLEAGIGCGFGIGYGFGVGLALKPGASEQMVQVAQALTGQLKRKVETVFKVDLDVLASKGLPSGSPLLPAPNGLLSKSNSYASNGPNVPGNQLASQQGNSSSMALSLPATTDAEKVTQLQVNQTVMTTLLKQQHELERLRSEIEALKAKLSLSTLGESPAIEDASISQGSDVGSVQGWKNSSSSSKGQKRSSKRLSERDFLSSLHQRLGHPCWKCWGKWRQVTSC